MVCKGKVGICMNIVVSYFVPRVLQSRNY